MTHPASAIAVTAQAVGLHQALPESTAAASAGDRAVQTVPQNANTKRYLSRDTLHIVHLA